MSLLFEPVRLGSVTLRNRIVFPPMTTGYEEKGVITARSRAFYRTVARGGAGLIVLGDVSTQPSFAPTPYLYDDSFITGLRTLVHDVQAEGARISAQLFHQEYDTAEIGRLMRTEGREVAKAQLHVDMDDYCNRLDLDELDRIRERFRLAALRVREAGFDMIQLHGDRLLGMFSSGVLNKRTDSYGGSLANRARFVLEVIQTIRSAVPDLPIEYKLAIIRTDPPSGKAGPTLEEARQMVPWLEDAGVAAFHVALANHGGIGETIPPMGTQPYGCFVDLAAGVKRVARVPVTAVGRILQPQFAAKVIESGQADLVGIGRGLIADPDWPRKVQSGHVGDLRLCIMCNHCASSLMSQHPLHCTVNPTVGDEEPRAIVPAAHPRRILVLGGGAAGMEAAYVAASRGHHVTLVEQGATLGGQLPLCAAPSFKHEVEHLGEYLKRQVAAHDVKVILGNTASLDALLDDVRPAAVIVATGGSPAMPPLPGRDDANVASAWAVLADEVSVGRRVAIVGGGAVGVETALYLAPRGIEVTIVEQLERIATGESSTMLPFIEKEIARLGVRVLTGHRVAAIEPGGLRVSTPEGATALVGCDTVVIAAGTRRNDTFRDAIEARGIEWYAVGDCSEARTGTLAGAVRDGFQAGLAV